MIGTSTETESIMNALLNISLISNLDCFVYKIALNIHCEDLCLLVANLICTASNIYTVYR